MPQTDYCTKEEVKAHFGISGSGQDTVIDAALPRVTALFNTALDRDLRQTDYTEELDGLGSAFLFLAQKPIVTIASVKEDGTLIDADDYVIYRDRSEIKLTNSIQVSRGFVGTFPRGDLHMEVIYTAGYLLEGTPSGNEIALPKDVNIAAILMVGFIIKNPAITNFVSERIGNYTYRKGAAGATEEARRYIPDEVWSIIFSYKRRDFETTRRGY